jgi:hypothetical protein
MKLKIGLLSIILWIISMYTKIKLSKCSTALSKTHTRTKTHTLTNSLIGMKTSFYYSMKNVKNSLNKNKNEFSSDQDYLKQAKDNVNKQTESKFNDLLNQSTMFKSKSPMDYTYWNGWVKFFKYNENDKPQGFFKNPSYYNQVKEDKLKASGNNGRSSEDNRSKGKETLFYLDLKNDSAFFIANKNKIYQSHEDVLHLQDIYDVPEDSLNTGGIKDFGVFSEGSCIKIKTHPKKNTPQRESSSLETKNDDINALSLNKLQTNDSNVYWIICALKNEEKLSFIKALTQNKLVLQRKMGKFVFKDSKLSRNFQEKAKESLNGDGGYLAKKKLQDSKLKLLSDNNPKNFTTGQVDGEWYMLQDWTDCSVACGGGYSYYHRICIPPKNNGKDCEGDPVLKVECNTQPCEVEKHNLIKNKTEEIKVKPSYKQSYFTDRPQRYDKCVIKESDLLIKNTFGETSGYQDSTYIPSRVVMNNRTLTVYKSAEASSRLISLDITDTNFYQSESNKKCFILRETTNKEIELCPFLTEEIIQEWNYDFNLFKYQCQNKRDVDVIEMTLRNDLRQKLAKAKKEAVKEREQDLKKEIDNLDAEKLEKKSIDLNYNSKIALAKELSIEERIKQEEEEKIEKEKQQIRDQIQREEDKGRLLLQAIEKKKEESQLNLKVKSELEEINSTKEKTESDIINQRVKLKIQLKKLKKRGELEKQLLKNQLMEVRTKFVDEVAQNMKKGDVEKCKSAMTNEEKKKAYCLYNFSENYELQLDCNSNNFCNVCCDNEFGGEFLEDREDCYKKVCYFTGINDDGKWIYQKNGDSLVSK